MGEIGNFVSLTQFDGGSTGKCGFYATATLAGSAAPGKATWAVAQIAASADSRFVQFDGADTTNNLTGMTQASLHQDLATYGLSGHDIGSDWASIKQAITGGKAVIVCVPEDQVYDMQLGSSPYPWNSTGFNHIILLTGISSDGNILARDSANIIVPNSIRPGPRTYRITALNPYWATAITPSWASQVQSQPSQEVEVIIELNTPDVSGFYAPSANGAWRCVKNGLHINGAMLSFYRRFGPGLAGITNLGLLLTDEFAIDPKHPEVKLLVCERGILAYDPNHVIDSPPGGGDVYTLHIDSGTGQQLIAKPLINALNKQANDLNSKIINLEAQVAQSQSQANSGQELIQLKTQFANLQSQLATYQKALQVVKATVQTLV